MAEYTVIPLLNAQQLSSVNVAHMANIMPETAQTLAGQLAVSLLRQEAKQVQKTDKGVQSPTVNDDEGSANLAGDPGQHKKRQAKAPEEDMEPSQPDNPLVGNLLNLKI